MALYQYTCDICGRNDLRWFPMVKGPKKWVKCLGCGKKAPRVYTVPNLDTDPHKHDLKPVRGQKNVWTNDAVNVRFEDDILNKDGLPVAEVPELVPENGEPVIETLRRAQQLEDWTPPKGEVHPLDFEPDMNVTRDVRRQTIAKGT